MPEQSSVTDARFMGAAMRLGSGALGLAWPNPAVGCVLVKDGRVIGRGRTAAGGRPHAETIALAEAGDGARGGTAYVTLEPCSHHGRTPPCAEALVAAGVARVVVTAVDPDSRVAGKGVQRLRSAGIDVATGPGALAAVDAHMGHFTKVLTGRPYLVLKLAVSADEGIGRVGEGNIAVSSETARRHSQALRSRFDAILVGRGTVEADDPALTCRLPGLERRSPVRVVFGGEGKLARNRRVFAGPGRAWVLGLAPDSGADGIRHLQVPAGAAGLDPAAALRRLAREGITRVLLEGGARLARTMLEADLVDTVMLFRSPVRLGGEVVPALAGLPLATIENSERFRRTDRRRFGPDRLTVFKRVR